MENSMKNIFILLFALVFFSFSFSALAQREGWESFPDEELTKKEAELRINKFVIENNNLKTKLAGLEADVEKLKKELDEVNKQIKDCNASIYSLVGATEADVNKFRQKLGVIDGKVRQMKGLSEDVRADKTNEIKSLENELNEMRMNKISCIREFYEKIIAIARDIRGLYAEKKIKEYVVGTWAENRDCLWNIAGKVEIYGDPFQWPKIWQGNTSQIKNPDIIFPGQRLTIPPAGPLTPEEKKAERKYWRNKRAMMESDQSGKKGE